MKIKTLFAKAGVLVLTSLLFLNCSDDTEAINAPDDAIVAPYTVADFKASVSQEEACFSRDLIAGQNQVVGQVTINVNEDGSWTLTYHTINGWSLRETHLSLSPDCENLTFPVTKTGNPKVGKFEYAASHEAGIDTVEYTIYQDSFSWEFCFAAHAVVDGPKGKETAWAEGESFDGKNWAMYVHAFLLGCLEQV
ncbi:MULTISPECIES: hypothetical protein [unclassified Leeuwenhoekiella]|uniref:hypothetical protein n=1 Tax=unclassified Leeuwenhoekiella TaxID=2615029 RepID=UPI000C460945|nr:MULTISPECIES: hypothetical protein [unclassified Leeuwenhoekiella]MAW95857.1 hypothetical protein [Leeuwenhoekiella sp.]MBA82872.1 hypothetical protein [Leeuwenhoekiella sp.]|tara:strand:+ start:12604 stop:13185 length:582 start_codon:yes stop_codon:yes gene_type:complete